MSLFKWCTPERRSGDRDLRIIPNEIYLTIFEHVALPSARLSPEQLETFTNLCLVCRSFGNLCLPRVFEHVEIHGFGNRAPLTRVGGHAPLTDSSASRGRMLCQHIAAKEPLALELARCVKVCYVTNWPLGLEVSSELQMLSQIYLTGIARMKHIHELKISYSNVKTDHWNVISTLESLQELRFHYCDFLESRADLDPDKVKVLCFEAKLCRGAYHPSAAIDSRHLRTLVIHLTNAQFGDEVGWVSETAVTELQICIDPVIPMSHIRHLQDILHHTARSLQVLTLPIYPFSDRSQILFEDPAWRNMPHLRSLTLRVQYRDISPMAVIRWICDAVRVHGGLQSFSVQDATNDPPHIVLSRDPLPPIALSRAEIRQIVHEELDCIPGLNFVEIGGTSVRLVDGKWMDAEGNAM
ncbi:hypothetical protein BU15DRAFT_80520 [Melanogaster broomeanus]|nr:hypothetical protein BU15DRAFT_80520 [Melanogaster broomeanus]